MKQTKPINIRQTVDKIRNQIQADISDHTLACKDGKHALNRLGHYYRKWGDLCKNERNQKLRFMHKFVRSHKRQLNVATTDLENFELTYDAYKYISADVERLKSACTTFKKYVKVFANIVTEYEISIMENTAALETETAMRDLANQDMKTATTKRLLLLLNAQDNNSRIMFLRHNIAQNTAARDQANHDWEAMQILYDMFKMRAKDVKRCAKTI